MDEPTVAVDPQSRNKILEGILKLNSQGATIIYTSHYMEEVEQICSRIAIMDKEMCIRDSLCSVPHSQSAYSIYSLYAESGRWDLILQAGHALSVPQTAQYKDSAA